MVRSKRSLDGRHDAIPAQEKKRKKSNDNEGRKILKDTSVFGELMCGQGIILKADNKANEITKDQAVFQRDLTLAIKRHPDYPEVIDEFVEALGKHIEDPVRFRWGLMPCLTPLDCEAGARGSSQDSIIRLLLGIEKMQPQIMNLLLEKLVEYTGDEEVIGDDKVNMPRLIMNQFRWLDRVVDSKELLEKMFEVLSVSCPEIQREIITCIPEVLDDVQHAQVAAKLRELLNESSSLAVPILDALSNLTLCVDDVAGVRGSVVAMLPSVEWEDLPVLVRFLLHTVKGSEDAYEVVQELREHLNFHSSVPPSESSTPHSRKSIIAATAKSSSDRGTESLTLDAIRAAIRFQRCIAEAWIKTIDAVKCTSEHRVLDVCVLLILHSSNHKKPVEALFRNKIRAGHFTEVLFSATFSSHAQVLREYFPSVLAISEVLLRSPDSCVTHTACAMYRHAFAAFDTYCRQEIVGNLVTHIGSGYEGEVDCSLDILKDLVNADIQKMAPFAIFVKGVLDYLDHLSVLQIRKLYSMLSSLAFLTQGEDSPAAMIQDELYIIIRKQITNNNPKYRRMGVIGAIMIVKCLAKNSSSNQTIDQSSMETSLPEDTYHQVINLLELVKTSSAKSPEATALFMDELSAVINQGSIDPKVEGWIGENVITDFQENYIVDVEPDKREGEAELPMNLQFGLDDENEAIAVNLLPVVVDSNKPKQPAGSSAKCLTPSFRLAQICEKRQHEGDLGGIDALLGCAMYLPKPECYDKLDSLSQKERHLVCEAHFLTVNWMREILNAFATQTDPEVKCKVITRLRNLTDLHTDLNKCLAATPTFQPPVANYDVEDTPTLKAAAAKKTGVGKRKRKDGGDKDIEADDTCDTSVLDKETQPETQPQTVDKSAAEKEAIDFSKYRAFFRELDMDVFHMLGVGLITMAALDTEMNTKDETLLQLHPPQLLFLVQDLSAKLEHSLIAQANTRRTFLKGKVDKKIGFSHVDQLGPESIARRTIKLLPVLCEHLEATNTFFQALLSSNDGVMDGPGYDTEESQLMAGCFHLLLQCTHTLLAWSGFLLSDNKPLLKQALAVMAGRTSTTDATQQPYQELIRQSFEYLEKFSSSVPNCPTAVTLCKLLSTLAERADSDDLKHKLAKISQDFLKRDWLTKTGEKEKGARHNELLQALIKIFFVNSADVLTSLESIATVGIPELLDTDDKNASSATYASLTRNSYPTYYRLLLIELVSCAKAVGVSKGTDALETRVDKLIQWNMAVRIFHILVNLVKSFDQRSNLGAVLKHGRIFVETFLRCAMPLIDHMFRSHKDDVLGVLKNLQQSTRVLHHMCGHSKILKDISLTNQIPLLKKCLEMFVYRVKVALTMNNCLEAFWMGNLKNRDLKGVEIMSQVSREESDGEEEEGEESVMPEDDDEESVDMDKESEASKDEEEETGIGQSYSEVF